MLRKAALVSACCAFACICSGQAVMEDYIILKRGDANSDGRVDITDATCISAYLFQGGPEPPCLNQADVNDDGKVTGSDSVHLLDWLFDGGSEPPTPGPYNKVCTVDAAPSPGCRIPPCE